MWQAFQKLANLLLSLQFKWMKITKLGLSILNNFFNEVLKNRLSTVIKFPLFLSQH